MDARRLSLILAGVALLGAGCGGSSSSSGTTSILTTTSTTTAAKTTSSAAATTSTSAATTTTTTVVPKTDFETFGPLGANPAVTVTLPMRGELPSRSIAAPIEGGLLVALTADAESHDSNPSTLAAIGFDGTKRWVRSVDSQVLGVWAAPTSSHATTVLVALDHNGGFEYHVVSAASGQDVAPTTDLGALTSFVPLAFSPSRLLLGRTPQGGSIPDALRVYDLATNSVESIALPSDVVSGTQYAWFGFDDKGEPTVSPDYQRVRAIYRNGSWVDDPSTVNAAVPPSADFTSEDQTLIGHQATGSMIWPDPQFTSPGYENSPLVADGDITIAALCTHSDNGICTAIELDGIDTDTGDVVWTLPGFRMLGAVGDGYALINDSPALDPDPNKAATLTPGWILIDTRTGNQVSDDQHWSDPSFFVQGCCDDYSSWVERFGGVVVAQNTDVLRVWLPRGATPANEHTLSLP